jgi:hypothetical protein
VLAKNDPCEADVFHPLQARQRYCVSKVREASADMSRWETRAIMPSYGQIVKRRP